MAAEKIQMRYTVKKTEFVMEPKYTLHTEGQTPSNKVSVLFTL